ncbi:MAG: TIGR04076 family protein [Thermodesulfobacteriota bacterium]
MAVTPKGFAVFEAEVVSAQEPCNAGHQVGERLELSAWQNGGLCGFFFHDIFPALTMMQFGGKYPWDSGEEMTVVCPDPSVRLTMVIRPKK